MKVFSNSVLHASDERAYTTWMSGLSHNPQMIYLDSIFVIGLILGGHTREPHNVQMSPRCRFPILISDWAKLTKALTR